MRRRCLLQPALLLQLLLLLPVAARQLLHAAAFAQAGSGRYATATAPAPDCCGPAVLWLLQQSSTALRATVAITGHSNAATSTPSVAGRCTASTPSRRRGDSATSHASVCCTTSRRWPAAASSKERT